MLITQRKIASDFDSHIFYWIKSSQWHAIWIMPRLWRGIIIMNAIARRISLINKQVILRDYLPLCDNCIGASLEHVFDVCLTR